MRAVLAGTDLLCLGRDQDQQMYARRPRRRWWTRVRSGRMPGERLEDAAARVAELRAWTASAARPGRARAGNGRRPRAGRDRAGRRAARGPGGRHRRSRCTGRSWSRWSRPPTWPPGRCPGAWAPGCRPTACAGSARATPAGEQASSIAGLLAEAAGRSLVIVVRDAHRHPGGRRRSSARSWPPGRTRSWWRWACPSGARRPGCTWPPSARPGPAAGPPPRSSASPAPEPPDRSATGRGSLARPRPAAGPGSRAAPRAAPRCLQDRGRRPLGLPQSLPPGLRAASAPPRGAPARPPGRPWRPCGPGRSSGAWRAVSGP